MPNDEPELAHYIIYVYLEEFYLSISKRGDVARRRPKFRPLICENIRTHIGDDLFRGQPTPLSTTTLQLRCRELRGPRSIVGSTHAHSHASVLPSPKQLSESLGTGWYHIFSWYTKSTISHARLHCLRGTIHTWYLVVNRTYQYDTKESYVYTHFYLNVLVLFIMVPRVLRRQREGHDKQDQILLVNMCNCIGFCTYRESYLLWSPVKVDGFRRLRCTHLLVFRLLLVN